MVKVKLVCYMWLSNFLNFPSLCHTFEDGTDTGYRNVGSKNSDAGEIPRRIHIRITTRRKSKSLTTNIFWLMIVIMLTTAFSVFLRATTRLYIFVLKRTLYNVQRNIYMMMRYQSPYIITSIHVKIAYGEGVQGGHGDCVAYVLTS
jgi:hypothetical protein